MAKMPMEYSEGTPTKKTLTLDSGITGTVNYWEDGNWCFVQVSVNNVPTSSAYNYVNTSASSTKLPLPNTNQSQFFAILHSNDATYAIARLEANGSLGFYRDNTTHIGFLGSFAYMKQ